MEKRYWEGIAIFLADWWGLVLLIVALVVTAILTRDLWMPLLFVVRPLMQRNI